MCSTAISIENLTDVILLSVHYGLYVQCITQQYHK